MFEVTPTATGQMQAKRLDSNLNLFQNWLQMIKIPKFVKHKFWGKPLFIEVDKNIWSAFEIKLYYDHYICAGM